MARTASYVRIWPILFATLLWATGLLPAALAAGTVKVDTISYAIKDHGTINLKTIELTDTNLGEGEVARMFSPGTAEEADALFARLDAAAITIAEIDVAAANQMYTLRDVRATGIKNGKVDRLSLGGLDGRVEVGGAGIDTVKVGAFAVENADLAPLLAGLAGGQLQSRRMAATRIIVSDIDVAAIDTEMPESAPGGNLYRIRLASFEVNNSQNGSAERSVATMKGMSIEPPRESRAAQSLRLYGYDRVDAESSFSGRSDPQARTYVLEDLTISMANVGSITLDATIGGVDTATLAGNGDSMMRALADGELSHLAIRITNSGYFERALAVTAAQEHKSTQQIRLKWTGAVEALAMNPGRGSTMRKLNDALAAFISDPKSLTLTLDAKRPVKFSELGEIRSPDDLMELVDLDAKSGP
ncbi:MAG TPA: hypothetical protein VK281_07970 [Xanthobacteraceae bacterium]|nr:hypothetical protein [Xanthobacteraceae bacterium]